MARAAGVGRQTVSNVLNGSGRVGEAAKARVRAAVTALGYYPNHGARSLRSRRTRQLGYVMPPIQLRPDNYIMQQFLQALAAASARLGHSVMVAGPDGDHHAVAPARARRRQRLQELLHDVVAWQQLDLRHHVRELPRPA